MHTASCLAVAADCQTATASTLTANPVGCHQTAIDSHGDMHTKMKQDKEETRNVSNEKDKPKEEARHQATESAHLKWSV